MRNVVHSLIESHQKQQIDEGVGERSRTNNSIDVGGGLGGRDRQGCLG